MLYYRVIFPLLILTLQVIIKLVVGRDIEKKHFSELLFELPTNIIFLALSLYIAFVFLNETIKIDYFFNFLIIIIFTLIIVSIFRLCKYLNDLTVTRIKKGILTLLILLNFVLALGCLYYASGQLMNKNIIYTQGKTQELNKALKCK